MIPGMNILNMAMTVIGQQSVLYYPFLRRDVNEIGLDETVYKGPYEKQGSLQAVPRSMYEQYGLDFSKKYVTFYTSNFVEAVDRDTSGDMLTYNGETYQVESTNDWYAQDGWMGVLCIKVEGSPCLRTN